MDTKWTADEKRHAKHLATMLGPIVGIAPFSLSLSIIGVITGIYELLIFLIVLLLSYFAWPHFLAMHKDNLYFRFGFWFVSITYTSLMLCAYYIHPVFAIGTVLLLIFWIVIMTMAATKYVRSTVSSLHTSNQKGIENE